MPLPILNVSHAPGDADLVRLFHRTELHWARHLGDESALDLGTAIVSPDLPNVYDANRVLDAALPADASPDAALAEMAEHFAAAGTRCAQVTPNPTVPADRTARLVEHLTAAGWRPHFADILHLAGRPAGPAREAAGLTIIPARASYRHARVLADAAAARWGEPQLAEAAVRHLDDPHYDAMIALRDGAAIARAGVLAVGDVGRIDQVFVTESARRQGIGRTMMSRALEACARSLFRHVMLSVDPENAGAHALYAPLGFRKVGQVVSYRAPWTK